MAERIQNLEYPSRPNNNAVGTRKKNMFNYKNLIIDDMIKYIPNHQFKKVHDIIFNAAEGDAYSYHG